MRVSAIPSKNAPPETLPHPINRIRPACNGGYFSETSLHPRIPPARPRDPVIRIKPQAPKARGCCCLIRIQVGNKERSLSPEPRLNGEC